MRGRFFRLVAPPFGLALDGGHAAAQRTGLRALAALLRRQRLAQRQCTIVGAAARVQFRQPTQTDRQLAAVAGCAPGGHGAQLMTDRSLPIPSAAVKRGRGHQGLGQNARTGAGLACKPQAGSGGGTRGRPSLQPGQHLDLRPQAGEFQHRERRPALGIQVRQNAFGFAQLLLGL
jgi:hypothetical protein